MTWVYFASPEVDAQSKWPTIMGVCICLTALMTATVLTRLWVRTCMVKSIGTDDYVMAASMICAIIYNALCIAQSRYGLGLPISLRPVANLNKYSEINFAGRPFYMAGITGFKVALCFAYIRITKGHSSVRYRHLIWAAMVLTILTHFGGALVLFFQCSPVKKSWRPRTAGKCLPNDITFYVLAAISIICDLIIFFLPIPILLKLHINIRRKVALVAIFMLGLFTTVCSIMRMAQIGIIAKTGDSTMLVLWGTIEMNVGIMLTSLPSLTPLFTFFANKAKSNSYGLSSSGGRNGPNLGHSARGDRFTFRRTLSRPGSDKTPSSMGQSGSEEHIVSPDAEEKNSTCIVKTIEFEVVQSDDEDGDHVHTPHEPHSYANSWK